MRLMFIYGPPGVGKLTVANEIAGRTGFKVFHNHLSIDAIEPIFEFGSKSFGRLVNLIRCETIGEAARQNVDLIYTFCYAKGSDDENVKRITEIVEENGGEVCFVLLTCDEETLCSRIKEPTRTSFRKVKDIGLLRKLLEQYDLYSTVPDRESLCIDNTNISPDAAAAMVIEYFSLLANKKGGCLDSQKYNGEAVKR
jgi:ATPase related to the helicase subunit of the Holliday junction resolvase